MRPTYCLATLAIGAILAVGLTPAFAGTEAQYPTVYTKFKYKLDDGVATFKGTITSGKGGCIPDRKVTLYRTKSGHTKKLGGDHTNKKGKFEIDLGNGRPSNGEYYSEIKQTNIGSSSNKKICLGRTSGSVTLSG